MKRIRAALAFVALGVRLFFIQVVDHAHYAAVGRPGPRESHHDGAARGNLRPLRPDPRGLASDVLVIADDLQIKHPAREAEAMSPLVKCR
jgi:hypothetical protein